MPKKASYTPQLDGMKYRVVSELGIGAGSTILQISDKMAGKRYALKAVRRLDPDDDIYIDQDKECGFDPFPVVVGPSGWPGSRPRPRRRGTGVASRDPNHPCQTGA